MKHKILIGPSTFSALDPEPTNKLLDAGFEVVDNPFGRKLTKGELKGLLREVSGIIAGLETLDREVLQESSLRVISRCGSGISNVDVQAAQEFGIEFYYTPSGPTTAVAELAVGMILNLIRQAPQMNTDLHQGNWSKKIGLELDGKVVLIIGFGHIGRKVAAILKAFGAKLIAVDPALDGEADGVPLVDLDDALPTADIITLHLSGDREVLGAREFQIMKKGVFLLNGARGGLLSEKHLIAGLENGTVAGAWLDVFEQEPYSGPLVKYPQVILTPHIGSYTRECRRQMEMESVENLIAGFKKIKVI